MTQAEELPPMTGSILPVTDEAAPSTGSGGFMESPAGTGATLPEETLPTEPVESPPIPSSLLVRLNEVLWAGSDLSTADEWLELTAIPQFTGATLTEPLSLEGWTITQAKDGGEAVLARLGSAQIIHSGGYLVIANYAADASRLRYPPSLVSSAMSVPNTKLLLRLRDSAGNLIDEVDDGIGAPFAGANPSGGTKASMERIDPRRSGTLKENWRTAPTARGVDKGALLLGTPGFLNGSIEPPDTETPLDATHARGFAFSGASILLWHPSASPDVALQHLEVTGTDGSVLLSRDLPAASTGVVLEGEWLAGAQFTHTSIDDSGNISLGTVISVQPLHKPIINELLPDPEGSDEGEWVELFNLFDQPLDLSGWTLRSGSRRYVFPVSSGSVLMSGVAGVLTARETGITLANAGGELELIILGRVVDRITYPALPEGISYGRKDVELAPLCSPTPGASNLSSPMSVSMSGFVSQGTEPFTLNLAAVASGGTLKGAQCRWDFGDGYTSDSCNPPAHRMKAGGDVLIRLEVQDYCGNTVIHTQSVFILQKANTVKEIEKSLSCTPAFSTGLVLTEIYPSPIKAEEEWIEIRNVSESTLSLCGWSVDDRDGGSKSFALGERMLGSGEYLVLSREETGIALNNDQDIARLIGPLPEGGTGVLQSLAYQTTVADQAGALPNPKGDDAYGEWIELYNPTIRPQWLNGWKIKTESGKTLDLHGNVIARKKHLKINLEKTGITLRNNYETLLLFDPAGQVRSVLSWHNAKDNIEVRQPQLQDAGLLEKVAVIDPQHLHGRFVLSEEEEEGPSTTVTLAGIATAPLEQVKIEYVNLLSALTRGKKVELKNDSLIQMNHVLIDGADIASIVLRAGLAYVPGGISFAKRLEYEAYEREARRQFRGLWKDEAATQTVEQRKLDEALDARAQTEGLRLTVNPPSGVVESGTLLSVESSLPASIFYRRDTGAMVPLSGGLLVQDGTYDVFGEYRYRTLTGSTVRSIVTSREYDLRRDKYEPCLKVSEIYPSPLSGQHEWVEIRNVCHADVSLLGWGLDDVHSAGSKLQMFGTGRVIAGQSVAVFSGSALKISLNNGGDAVTIYNPAGRVSDSVWYPSVKKGRSYALNRGVWCATDTITPSRDNECITKAVTKKKKDSKKATRIQIGLGTKYAASMQGIPEQLNKNRELHLSLFKGLNDNTDNENISFSIALYLLLLALIVGVLLLRMKNKK